MKIIDKGKLTARAGGIGVQKYILINKDGKTYLLLHLFNDTQKSLDAVSLCITQTDKTGKALPPRRLHSLAVNAAPHASFSLPHEILLNEGCVDFDVEVTSGFFAGYEYKLIDNELKVFCKGEPDIVDNQDCHSYVTPLKNAKTSLRFVPSRALVMLVVLLLMISMLAITLHIQGYTQRTNSFFYDGIEYSFNSVDKDVSKGVSVVGAKASKRYIQIPKTVSQYKVTSVAKNAFNGNEKISGLRIEGDVEIQDAAFYGCKNLESIDIKDVSSIGRLAFYGCSKIGELVLQNASIIGEQAFRASGLRQISITNSKKPLAILKNAFADCSFIVDVSIDQLIDYTQNEEFFSSSTFSMKSLHLKNYNYSFTLNGTDYSVEQNKSIARLFSQGLSLTATIRLNYLRIDYMDYIPQYFCFEISSLSEVVVGSLQVQVIENEAFSGCTSLSRLDIPTIRSVGDLAFYKSGITSFDAQRLTTIGVSAFEDCKNLSEFDLGENIFLTTIKQRAFMGCSSLRQIVLPASLQQIEEQAFSDCYKLHEVYNLSSLPVQRDAFDNGMVGYYALNIYLSQTQAAAARFIYQEFSFMQGSDGEWYLIEYAGEDNEIIFPKNLSYGGNLIGGYSLVKFLLQSNSTIKSIVILDDVNFVGDFAFYRMHSLQHFFGADSIQGYGEGVFKECYKLLSIQTPFVGQSRTQEGTLSYMLGESSYIDSQINQYSLQSVTLTDSLNIDDFAFYGCTTLVTVQLLCDTVSIGKYAFENCSSLMDIVLPQSLESIGEYAFRNCTNFSNVEIPSSTVQIGIGALENCYGITNLTLPFVGGTNSENGYFSYIFGGVDFNSTLEPYSYTLTLTTQSIIGHRAFSSHRGLKEIRLPQQVDTIKTRAFESLPELSRIRIYDVQVIEQQAFYECYYLYEIYNLGSLNIKAGESDNGSIAKNAVAVYTSLLSQTMTKVTVGEAEFLNYKTDWVLIKYNLSEESLVLGHIKDDSYSVGQYSIRASAFSGNMQLKELTVLENVKAIDEGSFASCQNLTRADFSLSVITELPKNAFMNCTKLVEVVLPPNLEIIGEFAFVYCSMLAAISIPSTVQNIESAAFTGCLSLVVVANQSSLYITKGSIEHGYVAYYAASVQTVDTISTTVVSGCVFTYVVSEWYLVYVPPQKSVLPSQFTFGGQTISSYVLLERALLELSGLISIPISVTRVESMSHDPPLSDITSINYEGTKQQFEQLFIGQSGQLTRKQVYYEIDM